ncbi:MAG: hypothetical protein U9O94_09365 [Nanoarchaeota archaeon]|nr:hypothetical protein [Nanoarchaeota archaeon]
MEDKIHSYLVKWTMDYLKGKDAFLKNIETIEENKGGFDLYVKFKESLKSEISNSYEPSIRKKEQSFVVKPIIEDVDEVLSRFNGEGRFGLVVFNTHGNFNVLLNKWNDFIKFKRLCIYFVNPASKLDKKWTIFPYTHNNICDSNSLERGLQTMFETVEPLIEASIKDKFK